VLLGSSNLKMSLIVTNKYDGSLLGGFAGTGKRGGGVVHKQHPPSASFMIRGMADRPSYRPSYRPCLSPGRRYNKGENEGREESVDWVWKLLPRRLTRPRCGAVHVSRVRA
jgi:hypothetical protein